MQPVRVSWSTYMVYNLCANDSCKLVFYTGKRRTNWKTKQKFKFAAVLFLFLLNGIATMSLQASLLPSAGQTPSSSGREIYRNGWLRCIPYLQTSDQLPKSHLENLFVSFCVHDDDGPWLEFYDNRHCSAEHKPVARSVSYRKRWNSCIRYPCTSRILF